MNDLFPVILGGTAGTMLDPITAGIGVVIAFAARRLTIALAIGLAAGCLLGMMSNSLFGGSDFTNVLIHILAIEMIVLIFYGLKRGVLCMRQSNQRSRSSQNNPKLTEKEDRNV
jgi:hypothetical protein